MFPSTQKTIKLLQWSLLFLAACLPAARAQDALGQIRAKGEAVVSTDATYPPFEYMEKGKLTGFDVDLGNEIGKELGVRIHWQPMEWSGVLGSLETRKADLVLSGVTITAPRKKENGFSRPYYLSGQTIARRRGDTRINGLRDLKDKIVSVQVGTTGQYAVQKLGVPDSRILKFDTLQDGLLDLRDRRADATVADDPALKRTLRRGYPELELVGGIFTHENLGVVARKGDTDLIAAVNAALDRIMVDGRYAALYQKWFEEPATTALLGELDRVKGDGTPIPPEVARRFAAKSTGTAGDTETAATGSAFTIRWDLLRQAMPQLLVGARLTLWVTFLSLIIGLPLGMLVALARLSSLPLVKQVATAYVEVVRGTPLLMQIYVIFFVLPALHLPNVSPLVSAVTALSLNAAAYISEIFRAGIESIDAGQMEAARSLGLDYRGAMRWVILPQTIRRVLPPLTNEAVALLKDSSLVSVVALAELMRKGKEFATDAGSPTTVYLAVALIYLAMTLPLTYLVRRFEGQWSPATRAKRLVLTQEEAGEAAV